MEFTVQKSAKDSLIQLANWVKVKAEDPVHENNRDLIADFLEKVVVVELKKLENKDEVRQVKVDIPDDDLPKRGPDPLELINKIVGTLAHELKDEDGNPLSVNDIVGALSDGPVTSVATPAPQPAVPASPAQTPKENFSGNNHKKGKKNDLTDEQRDYITQKFDEKNGWIEDDSLEIAKNLGLAVGDKTPWQVTGWISELHRRVQGISASGKTHQVPDMTKYVPPAKRPKQAASATQPTANQSGQTQTPTPQGPQAPKFAPDPNSLRMK